MLNKHCTDYNDRFTSLLLTSGKNTGQNKGFFSDEYRIILDNIRH